MTDIVAPHPVVHGDSIGSRRRRGPVSAAALLLVAIATGAVAASAPPAAAPDAGRVDTLHLMAPGVAPGALRVRVFLPPGYRAGETPGRSTLYLDDGQDAEAVGLRDTVAALAREGAIRAPVVVAIDAPPDRLGAYGFSDRAAGRAVVAPTRYGDVGTHAQAYSEWLVRTLVPFVESR